jgi:hypothetical protein
MPVPPADAPALALLSEELVPLRRAGVSPATAHRWAKVGILGPAGVRVRLEVIRVGGRLRTSTEAIRRFHAAINADLPPSPAPAPAPAGPAGPAPSAAWLARQREADAVLDAPIAGRKTRRPRG